MRQIGAGTSQLSISCLNYVVLSCRDFRAARRFYRDAMGLPVACERIGWIQFRVGTSIIALRPVEGGGVAEPAVQLGFRVGYDEVDACYEELKARGIEVLEPPRDQGWGHRTLFFADPEGNLLEIFADLPGQYGA